ncbi:MAG TPA: ABC transporter permease [Thermoanaerobaculia bacterium]|nr:ABC transporter permease [Thermoanaerobaculia bacterium]
MPDWREELRARVEPAHLEATREAEIVEELVQHLEERWEELVGRGDVAADASRTVLEELDDMLPARLAAVERRASNAPAAGEPTAAGPFTGLAKDLRYAVRQLRRNPSFTAIAVLSLALGTGANTAIFQLLDAVRLRALPVPEPRQLATVEIQTYGKGRSGSFHGRAPGESRLTNPQWEEIRARQEGFRQIAAWGGERMDLSRGGESRWADEIWVSGGFFPMLGVRAAAGRVLGPADDHRGCPAIGVLSEPFWRREYGGAADVVGRTLTLDSHPVQIVGVAEPGFGGVEVGRGFDVAVPICAEPILHAEETELDKRNHWWLGVIGRVKPGWSVERASAQLAVASRPVFEATVPPEYNAQDAKDYVRNRLSARPAASGVSPLRQTYVSPLAVLLVISAVVLVIACVNLANLMLARASARQREMGVRLALGASRGRLARQLLSESLLLAAIGTALGAALAQVLCRFLVAFLAEGRPNLSLDLAPNLTVLGFTALLGVATCLLFGLAPAIQASRTPPGEALKASARGVAGGKARLRLRRSLVASQVALSLVLVVGALLFVRTLRNLATLDPGFSGRRIVNASVELAPLKPTREQVGRVRQELLARVQKLPGVASAAAVEVVPLSGMGWNDDVRAGDPSAPAQLATFNRVSPGYFATMGTRLLAGRDLDARDTRGTPEVAVVTETFAQRYFGGANPVGKTLAKKELAGKPDRVYLIVGLVPDQKYTDLREEFLPIVFVAEAQDPEPKLHMELLVRAEASEADAVAAVKRTFAELAPSASLSFRTFESLTRRVLLSERLMATLSGFFGALAALLAMVGLYGVISYTVTQRRSEIGVRIALGAERGDIVRLVMGEAGWLLAAGLLAGGALALLLGGAARALLYGLRPADPATLAVAAATLASVAALASFVPARRAAGLDPTRALRDE